MCKIGGKNPISCPHIQTRSICYRIDLVEQVAILEDNFVKNTNGEYIVDQWIVKKCWTN